uniref:Amylo-alpha-1,6-glucosidase n=1 Tax=uncultured bacterium esnapd26 TaxID=1366607 RepID=S5UDG9_9BACT|nr:amylo-alpha-1,6-glucosidase [uncultured bacterium esnapd26]
MDITTKSQTIHAAVALPGPVGQGLQPFVHDAVVSLCAPSFVISHPDGQLDGGADGFYHGDVRALARLTVAVEGSALAPVSGGLERADQAGFRAVLRGLNEVTADPVVALCRRRTVSSGRLEEHFEVSNHGTRHVRFRLTVRASTDLAPMERVKSGHVLDDVPADAGVEAGALVWSRGGFAVRLLSTPAPDELDAAGGRLSYEIELAPGQSWSALLSGTAAHDDGDQFPAAPADRVPWRTPVLRSADRRFDRWLEQSIADLDQLRLTDPLSGDNGDNAAAHADQFLAAGAPWYLTLFGRDAIWAARMVLPLGTDLAAGTLRALALRQGRTADPATEEQLGKILHEVRRTTQEFGDKLMLPPVYYGTVDATPVDHPPARRMVLGPARRGSRTTAATRRVGAFMDTRPRRSGRRRLPQVHRPDRPGPGQPGLEGLRRRHPPPRRPPRRSADRAVRSTGVRL